VFGGRVPITEARFFIIQVKRQCPLTGYYSPLDKIPLTTVLLMFPHKASALIFVENSITSLTKA
jgi:hypothetical protein